MLIPNIIRKAYTIEILFHLPKYVVDRNSHPGRILYLLGKSLERLCGSG